MRASFRGFFRRWAIIEGTTVRGSYFCFLIVYMLGELIVDAMTQDTDWGGRKMELKGKGLLVVKLTLSHSIAETLVFVTRYILAIEAIKASVS